MTIEVKHNFVSQKADSPDSSLIQPSNWNDTHQIIMAANTIMGRGAGTPSQGPAQEFPLGDVGRQLIAAGTTAAALAAAGAAAAVHTHTIAQVTNLQASLDAKQNAATAWNTSNFNPGNYALEANSINRYNDAVGRDRELVRGMRKVAEGTGAMINGQSAYRCPAGAVMIGINTVGSGTSHQVTAIVWKYLQIFRDNYGWTTIGEE